jgi:hypothetical protein
MSYPITVYGKVPLSPRGPSISDDYLIIESMSISQNGTRTRAIGVCTRAEWMQRGGPKLLRNNLYSPNTHVEFTASRDINHGTLDPPQRMQNTIHTLNLQHPATSIMVP